MDSLILNNDMWQTVDISRDPETHAIVITTRKTKVSRTALARAQDRRSLRASSGSRRVAKVVSNQIAGYRPDLLRPAIARSNRLVHTSPVHVQNSPSTLREPKKLRGKKLRDAKAAKAASK
jgi:hypothetical protein